MYQTCPKCGYQNPPAADIPAICPGCGIVYAKWLKHQLGVQPAAAPAEPDATPENRLPWREYGARFLQIEDSVNPLVYWSRVLVFAGLAVWTWQFINMDFVNNPWAINNSFMHRINLVFHEAGHILFMPFGRFMGIVGGSLNQLLVPSIILVLLVFKYRNTFAAAVCLWWLGASFIDLAPYIDDALDQQMLLVGGFTGSDRPGHHDWGNILGEFNVLEKHRSYARIADSIGVLCLLLALAWGGWLLRRQFERLEKF